MKNAGNVVETKRKIGKEVEVKKERSGKIGWRLEN